MLINLVAAVSAERFCLLLLNDFDFQDCFPLAFKHLDIWIAST